MTPKQIAESLTDGGTQAMLAGLIMGAVLFGIPTILARLFVKWGIY